MIPAAGCNRREAGPLRRAPRPVSVGLAPRGPQLVRYAALPVSSACPEGTTGPLRPHRFPSGLPRGDHNWSATPRPSTGFRRACPEGTTTGPLRRAPRPVSLGLAPRGPQLVRYAAPLDRFPSGLPRGDHNWSATPRPSTGFPRACPEGTTTGPLRRAPQPVSLGLAPRGPQLVRYAAPLDRFPSGLPRGDHS